jgi:hypothetical protein
MENQCQAAWEWMSTLGSPATLVGGAALASFFELRDQLAPSEEDGRLIRSGKSLVLLLLLGSFACEICCVCKFLRTTHQFMLLKTPVPRRLYPAFPDVNTIAGDQIMANNDTPALAPFGMIEGTGNGPWGRGTGRINCTAASPHQMMHRELEFEYLASRVGFIQVHRETRTQLDIWSRALCIRARNPG